MMDSAVEQAWKDIFSLAAEAKAAKRHDEETKLFYETLDREKHDKQKVKEKREKETKDLEEAVATAAQIAAFNERLDDLDTKTVHALMENGEALDKIRDDLRRMEDNAYVLPDGRRVFKTADGRRVFDEKGVAVPRDVIDPEMIDNRHTSADAYQARKATAAELESERRGMLDFHARIDDAREKAAKGDMSKKQLDALGDDLQANAPPSVLRDRGTATPQVEAKRPGLDESLPAQLFSSTVEDPRRRTQPRPTPM